MAGDRDQAYYSGYPTFHRIRRLLDEQLAFEQTSPSSRPCEIDLHFRVRDPRTDIRKEMPPESRV